MKRILIVPIVALAIAGCGGGSSASGMNWTCRDFSTKTGPQYDRAITSIVNAARINGGHGNQSDMQSQAVALIGNACNGSASDAKPGNTVVSQLTAAFNMQLPSQYNVQP